MTTRRFPPTIGAIGFDFGVKPAISIVIPRKELLEPFVDTPTPPSPLCCLYPWPNPDGTPLYPPEDLPDSIMVRVFSDCWAEDFEFTEFTHVPGEYYFTANIAGRDYFVDATLTTFWSIRADSLDGGELVDTSGDDPNCLIYESHCALVADNFPDTFYCPEADCILTRAATASFPYSVNPNCGSKTIGGDACSWVGSFPSDLSPGNTAYLLLTYNSGPGYYGWELFIYDNYFDGTGPGGGPCYGVNHVEKDLSGGAHNNTPVGSYDMGVGIFTIT